jgi:hypothetical protein
MKLKRAALFLLGVATCLATTAAFTIANGQPALLYQQMSPSERSAFISQQIHRLAREMSGNNYEFTPAVRAAIEKQVDSYVQRIGNNSVQSGKSDLRLTFERGQSLAPTLNGIFRKQKVSPLIGLYIPLIESEFINIHSPNTAGAVGMYQFLPKTGEHLGLSAVDLLDVEKSADAAARYIMRNLKRFKDDPMKEALAILAYNRGADNVTRDLELLVTDQNRACSICALTANSDKLDPTFQNESVYYVPRFFAAAIIGENPQAFGLQTQPLSSF